MRFLNDISGKALLYAAPLFLAPFVDKLAPDLFNNSWPSYQSIVGCILLGTVSMCIGLRAFFDGSYERKKTENSESGSGNTAFVSKPNPPTQ